MAWARDRGLHSNPALAAYLMERHEHQDTVQEVLGHLATHQRLITEQLAEMAERVAVLEDRLGAR